jgi:hypothetical protein
MRIIENRDEIQKRCPGCNSLLGIHETDLHYDDVGHWGHWAQCVICGHRVKIEGKDIPKRWLENLGD